MLEFVSGSTCLLAAGSVPERLYGVATYAVAFIFLIGLLVLVHEWGHFIVARLTGMPVEEFWVGLPFPPIRSWKRGDMTVGIGAIPVGGFVKITGMNLEDGDHPDGFNSKPLWARIAVLLAGPAMNLVAAIVIIAMIFNVKGVPYATAAPSIGSIDTGRPADQAGLQLNDTILAIDGVRTEKVPEVMDLIKSSKGRTLKFLVRRNESEITISVKPAMMKRPALVDGHEVQLDQYGIGIGFTGEVYRRESLREATKKALLNMSLQTREVFVSLLELPRRLLTRPNQTFQTVGGPVSILRTTGDSAHRGTASYFRWMAFLSINLALFNLLPIPALDGGRILIILCGLVYQAIFRRPLDRKKEFWVHAAGLAFLLLFIIIVSAKDLKLWILG